MKVLIIVDHNNKEMNKSTLNTVSAGKMLGDVDLLVIGYNCMDIANTAAKLDGIQNVYYNDNACFKHLLSENTSDFISSFSEKYSHILFSNNTVGKNIAPRVAGLLDTMIIPDVIEIINENTFKRPIYAGNAIATCKSNDEVKILTIRSTAFEEEKFGSSEVEIKNINKNIDNSLSTFIKDDVVKSTRPELTTAEIVISGGRGLGSGDNFKILEKLADKLGAAMGASRAAVDAGFVPNDWQVGQTGKIVAPNLYIAVGISGAIQHLAGMKDSKVIVAINKDEDAPIFSVSDYGLADDLFKVIPEIEGKI